MPLSTYAARCWGIAAEFEPYLLEAEPGELEKLIGSFSVHEWMEWRQKNDAQLDALVELAPSARAKRLSKMDRRQRLLSVLGARQRCVEAAHLLQALGNSHLEGNSYRGAAARAGGVFQEMVYLMVPLIPEGWPMDVRFRDE